MPEVGINSTITTNNYSNFQRTGFDIGLKAGLDITENLALETGLNWAKIQSFPSVTFYNYSSESDIYHSFQNKSTSSNGFFSIPLHLKISHNIFNNKFKVFTFFGPRFIFGSMSYSQDEAYIYTGGENNEESYAYGGYGGYGEYNVDYTNATITKTRSFQPGILFDGGFGFEYKMNSYLSLQTKGSFSMGAKRLNSTSYLTSNTIEPDAKYIFDDTKWKGDGLNLSVGVKIKF